jgi:hypothetical protein
MLAHLLHKHAHLEEAEAAAAILDGTAHAPHAGRLHLARDAPVVVLLDFGRIGIDPRLGRDDFVLDDPANILAQGD